MDFHTYAPMIFINLALVVTALLVPFAHRFNELAGGLLLVGAEYAALLRLRAISSAARAARSCSTSSPRRRAS